MFHWHVCEQEKSVKSTWSENSIITAMTKASSITNILSPAKECASWRRWTISFEFIF